MLLSSFKASLSAFFLFDEEVCVKGRSFLSIFFNEPTRAKSLKPCSFSVSSILSTATFVRAQTKILVSVSSILSSKVATYLIIETSRYDLPQPKAPCTSTTFASAYFAAISSYRIAFVSLSLSDRASSIPMISKSSFCSFSDSRRDVLGSDSTFLLSFGKNHLVTSLRTNSWSLLRRKRMQVACLMASTSSGSQGFIILNFDFELAMPSMLSTYGLERSLNWIRFSINEE